MASQLKKAGQYTKAVEEKRWDAGRVWFEDVGDLLPLAAGLRKIASPDSPRARQFARKIGFTVRTYHRCTLMAQRKEDVEEAFAFIDTIMGSEEKQRRLAKRYGLRDTFHILEVAYGHVLGYPKCCVRHFILHEREQMALVGRKVPFNEWPENAKCQNSLAVVPWMMCTPNCRPSLEYKKKALALYARYMKIPKNWNKPRRLSIRGLIKAFRKAHRL